MQISRSRLLPLRTPLISTLSEFEESLYLYSVVAPLDEDRASLVLTNGIPLGTLSGRNEEERGGASGYARSAECDMFAEPKQQRRIAEGGVASTASSSDLQ
jgi:hypothetical protein